MCPCGQFAHRYYFYYYYEQYEYYPEEENKVFPLSFYHTPAAVSRGLERFSVQSNVAVVLHTIQLYPTETTMTTTATITTNDSASDENLKTNTP